MPSISEMRSISVLEQRVETSGVSQAAADLDRLTAAQKGAAAGADTVAEATDRATKRVTSLREQAERQWLSLDKGALAAQKYADECIEPWPCRLSGRLWSCASRLPV